MRRTFEVAHLRRAVTELAHQTKRRTAGIAGRVPPVGWIAALCLGLGMATLVSFAQLAEDYLTKDPLVAWDERFARWLHAVATPAGVDAFSVITLAGGSAFLFLLTGSTAFVLARRKRLDAAYLLAAFLGAEALNLGLKLLFARERPELDSPFVNLDTYSFPSGHANVSIAVYGAIAILLARRTPSWWARTSIVLAAAFLIALIGFSRLYLGAHFLSDVLAGFDAGFTWLMLCTAIWVAYPARCGLGFRESKRPDSTSTT